ncbi:related to CWF19-like protein DRN1 [Saccharomycodes ludwigii]|uniref:Related to CWF19-like protein DRN1 n=1 Tax=Saccharomycodes ludwigii TaxID=36035 RepID=A0A376B5C5_9ASCO|nr:hypothetical protein SCDLUD_002347 [Saccharomycodes ludwigii]KAH3900888.1 hypothetical protein SCDLUD_002347 [Saccharomycodes ludwigii]SSD59897.1 related to CWF19-like protein DRN1 [Saccharomycodes ludwigii]
MTEQSSSLLKVLFFNATIDSIKDAINKINQLNSKAGPFTFAFNINLIDNLSSIKETLDSTSVRYILLSKKEKNPGKNRSASLIQLTNPYGIYELESGFRIAYIKFDNDCNKVMKNIIPFFTKFGEFVDVLVTSYNQIETNFNKEQQYIIDSVIKLVKPFYHFTPNNETSDFVEEMPFLWDSVQRPARSLKIPQLHMGKKWAYAFNFDILKSLEVPTTLRSNPYLPKDNRKRKPLCIDGEKNLEKIKKLKTVQPTNCHFCFTNDNIEDHMIVSIGNNAYLTIAKGPLTVPQQGLPFPGHCIITSIEHIPKLNCRIKPSSHVFETSLYKEIIQFEQALCKMFAKFDMSIIVSEINFENAVHYHLQVYPVPNKYLDKFNISLEKHIHSNNEKYTSNAKLNFKKIHSVDDEDYKKLINNPSSNYFQFKVHKSDGEVEIFYSIFDPQHRLDLQFGRRVLAYILNQPKRIKWDSKICFESKEKETKNAQQFQELFREFDFTDAS